MHELELWGGPECTVNRVGDQYRDQLAASGHEERLSDIDLMADLGFATLRYPVLWERVAPHDPARNDWSWTDRQLEHIRSRGMRVIAGLVHHGSGPAYANILSDAFAPGLARHARNVAERYPWIDAWTPVNEPVTTARFCALYGFWHPHARDERLFWTRAAQPDRWRAARDAGRCGRSIRGARLVQTDDLGRTYATAALREQAAFDNARRWMGWDLLCGRVVPGHDLWAAAVRFRLRGPPAGNGGGAVPARHHRHQPLSHQRPLPRPPVAALSGPQPRQQQAPALCRHRGGARAGAAAAGSSRRRAGGVGAIRPAARHYRGAQWLHPRRTDALDMGSVERRARAAG
ncbi:MAG: glycoside hydrolase family 5 protein [Sphingobium sp.]|nr:glycoside hydrolase family 5 protein [Sphingobium sp.]